MDRRETHAVPVWRPPSSFFADLLANPLPEAPILRLGRTEARFVLQLLDFRDLCRLSLSGSPDFRRWFASRVLEARHLPTKHTNTLHIGSNPFLLLSRLPKLRVIALRGVSFRDTGISPDSPSPFACLPPTLEHLEFEEATPPGIETLHQDKGEPLFDISKFGKWYTNLNFAASFPKLKCLRLGLRKDLSPHFTPLEWVKTLPTSLEALSLSSFGHSAEIFYYLCGVQDSLDIEIGDPSVKRKRRNVAPSTEDRTLPLPSLTFVEFTATASDAIMDWCMLPPCWRRFQWVEDISATLSDFNFVNHNLNAPQEHEEGLLGLRSLSLAAESDLSFPWFEKYCPHLTHLEIFGINSNNAILPVTPSLKRLELHRRAQYFFNPRTAQRLLESGVQLDMLLVDSTYENIPSADALKKVMSTLTVIDVEWLGSSSDLACLPATLRVLRVSDDYDLENALSGPDILKLPPSLTELTWPHMFIELFLIPLLPRKLEILRFSPANLLPQGAKHITNEMRSEADARGELHLIEAIGPSTRVLYGLPPGLKHLVLTSPPFTFDENFGAYLPRSLLSLRSCGRDPILVNIDNTPKSVLAKWFGTSEPGAERVKEAICSFPPECECSLYFTKMFKRIGSSLISYQYMKDLFPPTNPLR